jgi:hypothetical protein
VTNKNIFRNVRHKEIKRKNERGREFDTDRRKEIKTEKESLKK